MVMQCPKCRTENLPDSAFCEECGAALEAACPSCGTNNRPSAKFCRKCRAPLNGTATAPAADRPPPPKHLADKVLAARASLEGERKLVTVLFADVKGSMDLAERLDPERWAVIMKRFFAIMTEGVERYEGYVDKFTGDGIMALFGAPIAHEDHARRACYAALHLQERLREYANELRLREGLNFSARIGLNSGEVVVGRVGDDLRMDYTAQGHTVGLAARMEQIAEPGKIYLTAHTAHELEGYFALEDLGELHVKGVQERVRVHELLGLGQARTRMDVSKSRGFSRFVGRGDEMQMLEAALARAREGNGQVVGIVGEAGLGKSRLCYEFLERCRARGLMTIETSGVAHGRAIPFLPMLRLFRAFFGISEQDTAPTARERIAGRLLLLDERLRESLPQVFDFMGVSDPANPAPRIDSDARQRQLFDIVRRVKRARSETEMTVALMEDLHWFDAGSEAFLDPLLDSTVGSPGLMILNFRPEHHASWMSRSNYRQIALAPLSGDAVRELVATLLGSDPSIAGLSSLIYARTEGNPFFIEEVVQALAETGKLAGSQGAYRLAVPIDALEVPSSVRALLAARIDRLAAREKDVLQTAAVIGREFDEPTLAAVVEQEAPQLREALQKLKDAEFVHERSLYPVAEYVFKHPLTQEVALASQLHERRRRLHAAVARVIEAAHGGDPGEQSALLAHHCEEAGDAAQAIRWHVQAAEWAGARDPLAGLRHWIRVRELGRGINDPAAAALRLRACVAIMVRGSWRLGMSDDETRACIDEARTLADALGRPAAVAIPMAGLAGRIAFAGRPEAAVVLATEARDLLDPNAPREERAAIEVSLAFCLSAAGRFRQTEEALGRLAKQCDGDRQIGHAMLGYSILRWGEAWEAWLAGLVGRFDDCWRLFERVIRVAREENEQELLGIALSEICHCAYWAGGATSVTADLRVAAVEGLEIAERVRSRASQVIALGGLGIADYLAGEHAACIERLTETVAHVREWRSGLNMGGAYLSVIADAQRALGDCASAAVNARLGIESADTCGAWFYAAVARAALADALVAGGDADESALAAISEARELVRKTGGNSLLPRLREAEARMLGRNDRTVLHAGLREAAGMYRAMGAPEPTDRLAKELAAG